MGRQVATQAGKALEQTVSSVCLAAVSFRFGMRTTEQEGWRRQGAAMSGSRTGMLEQTRPQCTLKGRCRYLGQL